MDFLYGYQEKKLKPFLKMAVQRLQIAGNKKGTACKHAKREIAKLLEIGKEEKARIKVEHVIREDFTMESYELIELLCELLHERVKYMSSQKECPPDLIEAVTTLIWCTDRVDIAELNEVKKQLSLKFGKEFSLAAQANATGRVNERLLEKLSVKPPSAHLVVSYLTEIAKEFDVSWQPTEIGVNDLAAPVNTPVGFSVPMAPGSEFRSVYQRQEPPPATTGAAVAVPPGWNPYSLGVAAGAGVAAPVPMPMPMAHPTIPPPMPPQQAPPPAYQEEPQTQAQQYDSAAAGKVNAIPVNPPSAPAHLSPPPHPPVPLTQDANINPSSNSTLNTNNYNDNNTSSSNNNIAPSFDDLEARFAALRNNHGSS